MDLARLFSTPSTIWKALKVVVHKALETIKESGGHAVGFLITSDDIVSESDLQALRSEFQIPIRAKKHMK